MSAARTWRKPTSEATADVYPAEYSEDVVVAVYPTEQRKGVVADWHSDGGRLPGRIQ